MSLIERSLPFISPLTILAIPLTICNASLCVFCVSLLLSHVSFSALYAAPSPRAAIWSRRASSRRACYWWLQYMQPRTTPAPEKATSMMNPVDFVGLTQLVLADVPCCA